MFLSRHFHPESVNSLSNRLANAIVGRTTGAGSVITVQVDCGSKPSSSLPKMSRPHPP